MKRTLSIPSTLAARLKSEEKVDGATDKLVRQAFTDFDVFILGEEVGLDVDVGALAVECTDFYGELAALEQGLRLAVACH